MSAHNNSVESSRGTDADTAGGAGQATDAGVGELHLAPDAIGSELVRLLSETHPADFAADATDGVAGAPVYDGHVALALDTDVLPGIDAALDMLTSSHDLFDVPAVDVHTIVDDSLPT
jgi:hypothetical protein